jgi:hypothetical protein
MTTGQQDDSIGVNNDVSGAIRKLSVSDYIDNDRIGVTIYAPSIDGVIHFQTTDKSKKESLRKLVRDNE